MTIMVLVVVNFPWNHKDGSCGSVGLNVKFSGSVLEVSRSILGVFWEHLRSLEYGDWKPANRVGHPLSIVVWLRGCHKEE